MFKTLEEKERVERRYRGSYVAEILQPSLQHEARRKEEVGQLAEDETVIARVGFGQARKSTAALVVEVPPSTITPPMDVP